MDFDADIRAHVLASLPHRPEHCAALEAKSTHELLVLYFNWRSRFIAARPRRVHFSQALQSNAMLRDPQTKTAFDHVTDMIAKGDDLTPYLSRRVTTGYEPSCTPGNYNARRDLDMMLNDWDVYHLHLSTVLEADGFVKRSGPLLFASFRGDDAYLIDVFPHGAWTREAILDILIDEWPDVGFVRELPNVLGLERQTSEGERAALRNAGISAPFTERNGKVYAVGSGGITTAGTSTRSTMRANHLLRALKGFADMLAANPGYISEQLRAHGVQPPETPDLHLVFFPDDTFAVVETHTNAKFILPGIPHPEPPKAQATA